MGLAGSYDGPLDLRAGPFLEIVEVDPGGLISPIAVPKPMLAAAVGCGLFIPLYEEARLLRGSKAREGRTAAFLGWMTARLLSGIEAELGRAAVLCWLIEPCVNNATEVEVP